LPRSQLKQNTHLNVNTPQTQTTARTHKDKDGGQAARKVCFGAANEEGNAIKSDFLPRPRRNSEKKKKVSQISLN